MSAWPREHADTLRRLRRATKLSFSEIATKINSEFNTSYTRNSVAGKVHKMGLCVSRPVKPAKEIVSPDPVSRPDRRNGGVGPMVQRINKLRSSSKSNYSTTGAEASGIIHRIKAVKRAKVDGPKVDGDGYKFRTADVASLNIGIMDLTANTCRWPTCDDTTAMTYCGLYCGAGEAGGMKSLDIIKSVLLDHQICGDDFFGALRTAPLVAARADAAKQLYEAGYGWAEMGRVLKREPSTIRNYLDVTMRERKADWHRNRRAMRFLDPVAKSVVTEIAALEDTKPEIIIAQWVNERAQYEAQAKREAA